MPVSATAIQDTFQRLGPERQLEIIYHGAALRLNELNQRYFLAQSKVHAEDDVFIGMNSLILKGLTIGRGTIGRGTIGRGVWSPGMCRRGCLPPFSVAGNPARVVKRLENDQ